MCWYAAFLVLCAVALANAQVDVVSISCVGGSPCSSECASFCTAMDAFDPTPGAYSDVTASASNGFSIVCNTQTEVDLIASAMASHTSGNPGVVVVCNGEDWVIHDACGGACPDGVARTITINSDADDACRCDSAADDFSMRPCIGNANWGGAGGATCNGPSLTLSISATLTVTGGGGDPHIIAPNLPRHFELHSFFESLGRSYGDMSVTLMDMEDLTLIGEVSSQPETEKYYFTSFRLFSEEEALEISFEARDGRAHAVVHTESTTLSCLDSADHVTTFSDASIRLQCTGAQDEAAESTLMARRFPSHIPFVHTGVLLEAPAYAVKFFFVQKDEAAMEFGFFDFQVSHSPSVDVGGVFANAFDNEATSGERSELSATEAMLFKSRRMMDFISSHISHH